MRAQCPCPARRESADRRFLANWQEKANNLKRRWASKVDELRDKLRRGTSGGGGGGGGGGIGGGVYGEGEEAPLLLLARMFAQEESAIEGLEEMWNRDPKWTGFFLPQVRWKEFLANLSGGFVGWDGGGCRLEAVIGRKVPVVS